MRDQEKAIIWCQLTAVLVYLYAVFKLLNVITVIITAHQSPEQRDRYKDLFNISETEAMVLIIPFAVGAIGLNLQQRCRRVHIVESAHNDSTLGQAIGRTRRLGNPNSVVYIYQYYIGGTFDDVIVRRNIEKAIPEAMAELNRQLFSGADDDTQASVDIGEWCLVNGHLVRVEEAQDMMVEEDGVPVPISTYIVLYLRHRLLVGKSTVQNFPLYTRGRHYLLAYIKALIASTPAIRYDNTNGNQYQECALNIFVIATVAYHSWIPVIHG